MFRKRFFIASAPQTTRGFTLQLAFQHKKNSTLVDNNTFSHRFWARKNRTRRYYNWSETENKKKKEKKKLGARASCSQKQAKTHHISYEVFLISCQQVESRLAPPPKTKHLIDTYNGSKATNRSLIQSAAPTNQKHIPAPANILL